MRLAAIADLHVGPNPAYNLHQLLQDVSRQADVLLLPGDLTDAGTVEDAGILKQELDQLRIPVVAVLGNHDYEHGRQAAIKRLLNSEHVHILDGESIDIDGVGFAGIKGFGGGFDRHLLPKWGEQLLKDFVEEGVNQALQLEAALAKLASDKKVVLLHYSPVRSTIIGESEEIFPFMGLSRLAGPIERFGVQLTFHGHAHHGTHEGTTEHGLPVFNVSKPLLNRLNLQASFHEI